MRVKIEAEFFGQVRTRRSDFGRPSVDRLLQLEKDIVLFRSQVLPRFMHPAVRRVNIPLRLRIIGWARIRVKP